MYEQHGKYTCPCGVVAAAGHILKSAHTHKDSAEGGYQVGGGGGLEKGLRYSFSLHRVYLLPEARSNAHRASTPQVAAIEKSTRLQINLHDLPATRNFNWMQAMRWNAHTKSQANNHAVLPSIHSVVQMVGLVFQITGEGDSGMLLSCGLDVYCCQSAVDANICNCATGEGTFAILAGRAEAAIEPSGPVTTSIPVDGIGSPSGTVDKAAIPPTSTASLQQSVDLSVSSKTFPPGTDSLADQSTPATDSTSASTGDFAPTTGTTDNSIAATPESTTDSPNISTGIPLSSTPSSAGSIPTSTTTTPNSPPALTGITAPVATTAASSSNNKALKIGLGVGLPLAFILLGCAAFLFFRRRRSHPYQSYPSSQEKTPLHGPPSPTVRPTSAFHPISEVRPTSIFAPAGPLTSSPVTGDTLRTSGTTLVTSAIAPKADGHKSSSYSAYKPYNQSRASRASRAETFRDSATFAGSEPFSPSSPRMATAVPILRLNQESFPRVDNYRVSAERDEELVSPVSSGGRSGRSRLSAVSGVTIGDDGLGISSLERTSVVHERNASNGSNSSNISNPSSSSNSAAPAPVIPRKVPPARQSTATASGGSPSSTGSPGEILGTGNVRHESARVVNPFSVPYEGT
ncbi:hypothetical protein B7494_g939 [Chlorociboria aeruginascens]|nr:hypothetical protein B7494_g939 [Chlorociboria aeruginascens]